MNLTDTERKLLRILVNRYGTNQVMIDIDLLARLSGRTPECVQQALQSLDTKGCISYFVTRVEVLIPWPEKVEDRPKIDPSRWRD